jgi:hypothetical protein
LPVSPTVLSINGFAVRIRFVASHGSFAHTRREHGPEHVHIEKSGAEVVIWLGSEAELPSVGDCHGMRAADVVSALRIVNDNRAILLAEWERING